MPIVYLAPDPVQSTFLLPGSNTPGNGVQLFCYVAGSVSTKQNIYTDNTGNTSWSNPLVLDSGGNIPNGGTIWIPQGLPAKFVWAPSNDTDPPQSPYRTIDNVSGINDVTVQEWISGPTPSFINSSTYIVVGDQTATISLGRRQKFQVTAGTVYGTVVNAAFASASTTVQVRMDGSSALDAGLTSEAYGLLAALHPSIAQAFVFADLKATVRVSLSSSDPVSSSDITAASAIWVHPYKGNAIDLYDGSANWNRFAFNAMSTAVPASSNALYDLTIFNNSGVLALSSTVWSTATSRAVQLANQNGVNVLTGALNHLYLATYRTTTTAAFTEDSVIKRYVWNNYNRVIRQMRVTEPADSWNYTASSFRYANSSAANQLDFVIGIAEEPVFARAIGSAGNSSSNVQVVTGVGLDTTTSMAAGCINAVFNTGDVGNRASPDATWTGVPGIGRHFLSWLEYSQVLGTTTWSGDNGTPAIAQTGIYGWLHG